MLINNKLTILFPYILGVLLLSCKDSDNNFFQKNAGIDTTQKTPESKQTKVTKWKKASEAMNVLFIGNWCRPQFNKENLIGKEEIPSNFVKKEMCNESEKTVLKIRSITKCGDNVSVLYQKEMLRWF